MHILYFHQYFITRNVSGGTRSYELARAFIDRGHRVTMIAASDPTRPWQQRGLYRRSEVDGIEVWEMRAGYADTLAGTAISYAERIRKFLEFALVSSMSGLRVAQPDVVYATSTPLTIGIPGMLASAFHRVPLVFEVRDLWPEGRSRSGHCAIQPRFWRHAGSNERSIVDRAILLLFHLGCARA
jgi:hypothetical protein